MESEGITAEEAEKIAREMYFTLQIHLLIFK